MELHKYKICPECGKENLPNLMECRYCEADLTGVRVVDDSIKPTSETTSAPESEPTQMDLIRICECGNKNAPQARKCSACGEDISDIIPTPADNAAVPAFTYNLIAPDGSFSLTIDKPLLIVGRESELKDYLQSKVYVSRQHAKLTVVSGKVFIENLSRTNKTFLNNNEIPDAVPTLLTNGDEIGLGGKVINGLRQDNAAYFVFQVKS